MSISVVWDALQCVLLWWTHCSASLPQSFVEGRGAFLAFGALKLLHHVDQYLHAFDG